MIPETAGALLAFLGLVAPGLVFQLLREQRRPQFVETTFREISRVALSSLVFSTVALAAVLALAEAWPALPDVTSWLADPDYLHDHYGRALLFLALEVALACGLAVLVEAATADAPTGRMANGSLWYQVLDRDKPRGATRTWLWVHLEDGSQLKGSLRGYDTGPTKDVREIALGGSPLRWSPPLATTAATSTPVERTWTDLTDFDVVVVASDQIRTFMVEYLDSSGHALRATPPTSTRGDGVLNYFVQRRRAPAESGRP